MSLYSPEFCNKWLRSVPSDRGVISASDAILAYSIVFLVITILVAFLKTEKVDDSEKPPPMIETYKTMSKIMFLPPVRQWIFILFTVKIGTAAAGELAMLKMTERGLRKMDQAFGL